MTEYLDEHMKKWTVICQDSHTITERLVIKEGTLYRTRWQHREGIAMAFVPKEKVDDKKG